MTDAEQGRSHAVPLRASAFLVIGFLALLFVSAKVVAETETMSATDPLLADVMRMLEVGIESELIVRWIETGNRRPAAVAADDLIALKRAGASNGLMEALLGSVSKQTPPAATSSTDPAGDMPADGAADVEKPVEPSTFQAPAKAMLDNGPTDANCCLVEFSVEYRAAEDREGEELAQPGRDLFLYVDGQFLASLESQGSIASRGPVRFKVRLPPGDHVLRLTRELHTPARGVASSETWAHETTVSPSIIPLEVAPGSNWQLDLRWVQAEFSTAKPLTWRWIKDGEKVAGAARAGAFREQWPYLCEDAEISGESGAIAGWRVRDRLKSCVRWASLWPDGTETARAELLHELGRVGFKPVTGARLSMR